jgi:hypothetical protein
MNIKESQKTIVREKIATKQKNQKPTLEQEYKRLQQSIRNNEVNKIESSNR